MHQWQPEHSTVMLRELSYMSKDIFPKSQTPEASKTTSHAEPQTKYSSENKKLLQLGHIHMEDKNYL